MKVREPGEFGLVEPLAGMIASQSRKPAFSDNRLIMETGDDAGSPVSLPGKGWDHLRTGRSQK